MILGAAVPRYLTRAQPHERGGKSSSSGLHGRSSIANRIPVYNRGAQPHEFEPFDVPVPTKFIMPKLSME